MERLRSNESNGTNGKVEKIETKMLSIDPESVDEEPVQRMIQEEVVPLLRAGFPIAIPTETVYGLAANAFDPVAISKIFLMKGRPSDNPLIVHISSLDQLSSLVAPHSLPKPGSPLSTIIETFWPGPLTILFDKSPFVLLLPSSSSSSSSSSS